MTPSGFVAGLADVMDVPRTELATVDRSLAKNGLRQVARGRFYPDINLNEGLQIALAWAGAKNLTNAAEEVRRLKEFVVIGVEDTEPKRPVDEEFLNIFGLERNEISGMNLFAVARLVACSAGAGGFPANVFSIRIEKNGGVEVGYGPGIHRKTLGFVKLGKFDHRTSPNVKVFVELSGAVLKWIFDATRAA